MVSYGKKRVINFRFHERQSGEINPFPDRQHNSYKIFSKEIWEFLLERGITITPEYLPSRLNIIADRESRAKIDSSEWKMCPEAFSQVCQKLGIPQIDLFASRLRHQLPRYMAYQTLKKIIVVTPTWHAQPWYPQLLYMSIERPQLFPKQNNPLKDPLGRVPTLVIANKTLKLVAWKISGKDYLCQEF